MTSPPAAGQTGAPAPRAAVPTAPPATAPTTAHPAGGGAVVAPPPAGPNSGEAPASGSPGQAAPVAHRVNPSVYFSGDVAGLVRQQPTTIHLTSDQNVKNIHWRSWGGTEASGKGTEYFGRADGLPPASVNLTLSDARKCGASERYLSLHVTFVGRASGTPVGPSNERVAYTCHSPF